MLEAHFPGSEVLDDKHLAQRYLPGLLVSWARDYVLAAWFKLAISSFNDHKPLAEDVIFLDLSQESLDVKIGLVMTFRLYCSQICSIILEGKK
jgi:hypothetical protein